MTPKVSVIMSVYNAEKYLKDSIQSILSQTYKNFEFLIIDDGSTDKSVEIIETFKDARIKLIKNKENLGVSLSRNKALNMAAGEYIVTMDADDISLPKRIAKQVKFMDKNPEVGICGSWMKTLGKKSFIIKYPESHERIKCYLLFYSPIANPTTIVRKDIIKKHNLGYEEDFLVAHDYYLWTEIYKSTFLANIPEVLLLYRQHESQLTAKSKALTKENIAIWQKQLNDLEIKPTDEEISTHNSIATRNYIVKDFMIEKTECWLTKLQVQNEKVNLYDRKIFQDLIAERWLILCKDMAKYGIYTWAVFWKSPLSKRANLSLIDKFKFLIILLAGKMNYYKIYYRLLSFRKA
ncbi:MAG: glycosyl transferase family 2 [uncultured bacterium]|nr:MAG: glycosyl transferase family 2 [uncultured bacterium]